MSGHDLRLELAADPRLLEAVRGLVRAYVAGFGIAEERAEKAVLAVNEACCNAIRHSYGRRRDGRLVLTLSATARHIEFELRDTGRPAPPDRVAYRPLETPARDRVSPGGLGVAWIYAAFDEVEYARGRTRGNRVRMRLKRNSGERA